jgi:hypothetical protein
MTNEINHVERIYRRHAAAIRRINAEERGINSDAALLSLMLAIQELAETLQHDDYALDEQLDAVEHVLEAHDSALFADVASGRTPLATAIDALIGADRAALASVARSNRDLDALIASMRQQMDADLLGAVERLRGWMLTHSPQYMENAANNPIDMAIVNLQLFESEVAAMRDSIADRRALHEMTALGEWLNNERPGILAGAGDKEIAAGALEALKQQRMDYETLEHAYLAALGNWSEEVRVLGLKLAEAERDRDALRQQLIALDADNAKLTQELATLRSWVTAPAGDGKSDPMSANVAAIIQKPAVDSLSQAASDYWIGLDAGRWSWRSVPRSVQLEMVRHVIAGTESHTKMEFDAVKPDWMPTATAQTQKFSATWSELSDLNREVQP